MKIFKFESKSDPGVVHTVTVSDSGRVSCTCRGFASPNGCWHARSVSEQAAKPATLPFEGHAPATSDFIAPMLASALPEDKSILDYADAARILEEKYDGHRMVVRVAADHSYSAWSRQGNARTLPAHIAAQLKFLPAGAYDGELYIPGGTATDVPTLLRQHELKLVLFDVLSVGKVSAMHLPGRDRRKLLDAATVLLETDDVSVAPQFPVTDAGLQAIWNRGGEGAIIKRLDAVYEPGKRVKGWIKFKREQAAEITITGFEAGSLGPHSVICGVDAHGIKVRAKARNDEWRAMFAGKGAAAFVGRKLVISYQEKTSKGNYKHPMADHLL